MGNSPTNKAVVIGVSDYPAPIRKLLAVSADVREMAKILQSKDGVFPKSGTIMLGDGQATKSEIESALATAFSADTGDTVFVYLAGHGGVEGGGYYFVPHDAEIGDLAHSAVSLNWIRDQFDQCASDRLILWLDCCHSGGIHKTRSIEDEATILQRTLEVVAGRGRVIVTACTAEQSAYESESIGHGFFTHSLLRGLQGEAAVKGEVTAGNLYEFIDREIGSIRQRPTLFGHFTGRMVLVHREARKSADASRTKPAIKEPNDATSTSEHWVLLGKHFLDVSKVRRTHDGAFSIDLHSDSAERDAIVQALRPQSQYHHGESIPFAFGNDACDVEVSGVTSESVSGGQSWNLTLKPVEARHNLMETTIVENNRQYSPGDIAELRVRSILLDERLPVARGIHDFSLLNNAVEYAPGGGRYPSIVREVRNAYKNHGTLWKELAKLKAVYLLKVTGTVEHVLELTIGKVSGGKVAVTFRGRRYQEYSNVEPETISVSGQCPLDMAT
jgi:hypothetical protein